MEDNTPSLEVKEDGQIWLIPDAPTDPRDMIPAEEFSPYVSSYAAPYLKQYEKELASAERILVSNQEVARQYLRLHEAKAFEASTDNWPDFTLKPGIYPIPDLKWEVKAEPIDCPDGIEGCEVMHLRNVAVISLPESKSESPLIGEPKTNNMKTAEELLKPYIETPFRHTQIVEKDNALLAMQKYADQFRGIEWIVITDQKPPDYERVLYFDSRDKKVNVGYFVWRQTPVDYVTHWMRLPANP